MVRFYLRFTGRVQGVGFRFFVAMNAERCHLTGWVKNMSDGSVTAEVQGTRVCLLYTSISNSVLRMESTSLQHHSSVMQKL